VRVVSVVPSKGRPDALSAKTLSWLCLSKHDFFVFVEPQDYEAYSKVVAQEQLVRLEKNDQGLGYAKASIESWLKDKNYDVVIKMDDDVRGWQKRSTKSTPEISAKLFDTAVADAIEAFGKYKDLAAVVFPYRWELWSVKKWTGVNARCQTVYIVRKEFFRGDPRISTFEDFHTYMQIRAANKMTLRYGLIGIDNDVGKAAGGLQSFDRDALAKREIELLREVYPALEVKKVEGKAWSVEPKLAGAFFAQKGL
jgi:hypothetical protein